MNSTRADIEIIFDDVSTDDPVVTADIVTPWGVLKVMAAVTWADRRLELDGVHVQGLEANAFGVRGLIRTLRALLESVDADEIIIRGAVRTSGANPGHRPRDIRIARKIQPAA